MRDRDLSGFLVLFLGHAALRRRRFRVPFLSEGLEATQRWRVLVVPLFVFFLNEYKKKGRKMNTKIDRDKEANCKHY